MRWIKIGNGDTPIYSTAPQNVRYGTKSPAPATGCLGMLGGCRTSGANLRKDARHAELQLACVLTD